MQAWQLRLGLQVQGHIETQRSDCGKVRAQGLGFEGLRALGLLVLGFRVLGFRV